MGADRRWPVPDLGDGRFGIVKAAIRGSRLGSHLGEKRSAAFRE